MRCRVLLDPLDATAEKGRDREREREREVNDSLGVSVIADALPVKSCSQALQKAALAL